MSLDSIARVQSRIASIAGRPLMASSQPQNTVPGGSSFASLLSQYSGTVATNGSQRAAKFVELATAQNGDKYVMGHETSVSDTDPTTFDCSELVEWAASKVGVSVPDGSWLQYLDLKQRNALMPVEEALRTPGALLFSFSSEPQLGGGRPSSAHVAISLGDGRTIEARGSNYGVGVFEAGDRFEFAGMIPEFR